MATALGTDAPESDTSVTDESKTTTPPPGDTSATDESKTTNPPLGDTPATDENKTDATPKTNDWAAVRKQIANGDTAIENMLSRYGTLEEALKGGVEAQKQLRAKKGVTPITKDSTPEEIKAYREAYGIPEKADGYEINLPDGVIVGEVDKPLVDAFLEVAHEHNIPPAAANAIIAKQLELQNAMIEEQEAADEAAREATSAELLSPETGWGSEAKLNKNLINNMLEQAPEGVKDLIENARLADGTLLGNHAPTLKWLASVARELNPTATLTPGNTDNTVTSIQGRLTTLEKMMGDQKSDYWKGSSAAGLQEEYRLLVEKRDLITGKGKK